MKIEIRNRWTAAVIFECEADSMRIAVELAVSKKISLRAADLRDANLSDANLRDANLSDANLSDANLRAANLRDANLSDANLSAANLRAANLRDANLSAANLRDANLRAANLRAANLSDANLRDANLRDANLRDAETDFFARLALAKGEVVGLYKALLDGRIDGSCYTGECACFVGTVANVRGVKPEDLKDLIGLGMDSSSPTEIWFMSIRKGHTPENSSVAAITAEWIRQFCKEGGIALPTRRTVWDEPAAAQA